jgi:predicted amidophosphoribosyltransferase
MDNLKNSFMLVEENIKLLKGKNVLIVDDVFTTGATLSECARVLCSSKASKPAIVNSYTFAKTKLFSTRKG